jgi:hypothetical protein
MLSPLWSSGQSSWLQNGDVLCFLWGTNWIYICYIEESRPRLRSSGHGSWLQIHRSGLDSRCYQIFWEVVGLERSPLSSWVQLRSCLKQKETALFQKREITTVEDPSRWLRYTALSAKFGTNFIKKLHSFGRYSSLCGLRPRSSFCFCFVIVCSM